MYGHTASGKTHTMLGGAQQSGFLPLSVKGIFDYIDSVCTCSVYDIILYPHMYK